MKKPLYSLILLTALSCPFAQAQAEPTAADTPAITPSYKFQDSELDMEERLDDLVSLLTLQEKISLLGETAPAIPRLGITAYNHGNEALHGIVRPGNFTVYPRPLGLAATFNPAAIRRMADQISDEARARYNELNKECVGGQFGGRYNGLLTFWSPTVNMARDPRWGRTGETYGEDPTLTAELGAAFTKGLQGTGEYYKAIATPKHYVANNQETDRFAYNAQIPMRSLREYYLKGFEGCICDGGAFSIMAAYNAINGVPCSANPLLLNEILRDEWGFEGYVVGDLNSPLYVQQRHNYTKTMEETAAICLKSGLDLDSGFIPFQSLEAAVKHGLCSEDDVTQAVRRVLMGRFLLGMFEPEDAVTYNKLKPEIIGAYPHQALALKLAEQGIVLLKNDKLLPFGEGIKKVALLGSCIDTYKHKQYSCEEESANPAITPRLGIRDYCQKNDIELIEIDKTNIEQMQGFAPVDSIYLSAGADAEKTGLLATYESEVISKDKLKPQRVDSTIDINREGKAPDTYVIAPNINVSWKGQLTPPNTGEYKFKLVFNGDISGSIAGVAFDTATENGQEQSREISVPLSEGTPVDVLINYADSQGNAQCRLEWLCPSPSAEEREARLAQLADCDAVVMVMGLSSLSTGEGEDKLSLDLPAEQSSLIKEVQAVNKNIALVLMNSTPLAINWEKENIPAILEAWYPGEQGGKALTKILWGECNPSGKLPMTFHKSLEDIPAFDSYDITEGRTYMYNKHEPLFAFGHGLSYTQFSFTNIETDKVIYSGNDYIVLTFDLANVGDQDGDEVAQVYIKPLKVDAAITLPNKQLKAFKRESLMVGTSTPMTFEIPLRDINYFDEESNSFKTYHGEIELQVGNASDNIILKKTITIK